MKKEKLIENPEFYKNLSWAYEEIERKFTGYRSEKRFSEWRKLCETHSSDLPSVVTAIQIMDSQYQKGSRVVVPLGKGLAVKVNITKTRGGFYITSLDKDKNFDMHFVEEEMQFRLRNYGFTRKNGFYIPEHKIIGLKIEEDRIKVIPNGHGATIVEDMTEDGKYEVRDIREEDFWNLINREEFAKQYKRNLDALVSMINNPKIKTTIPRHGSIKECPEYLTRMLLAKIKDNVGEIFIGDLDNVCFDEVKK